jgi:hypothetical protein
MGLQFLDDTVSFAKMRLARDGDGHVKIARTYTFGVLGYPETIRRDGGDPSCWAASCRTLQLEPYLLH